MAKKELIPTKQEKAYERIKNFRGELADYRQTLDRLKKDSEDIVMPPQKSRQSLLTYGPVWPTLLLMLCLGAANHPKSHRAPRPPPPSYSNARESICPIQSRAKLPLRPFKTPVALLRRCSPRLYPRNTRSTRTKFHVHHKCGARRIPRARSRSARGPW